MPSSSFRALTSFHSVGAADSLTLHQTLIEARRRASSGIERSRWPAVQGDPVSRRPRNTSVPSYRPIQEGAGSRPSTNSRSSLDTRPFFPSPRLRLAPRAAGARARSMLARGAAAARPLRARARSYALRGGGGEGIHGSRDLAFRRRWTPVAS